MTGPETRPYAVPVHAIGDSHRPPAVPDDAAQMPADRDDGRAVAVWLMAAALVCLSIVAGVVAWGIWRALGEAGL